MSKTIELTQGKSVIVDDQDYKKLKPKRANPFRIGKPL